MKLIKNNKLNRTIYDSKIDYTFNDFDVLLVDLNKETKIQFYNIFHSMTLHNICELLEMSKSRRLTTHEETVLYVKCHELDENSR